MNPNTVNPNSFCDNPLEELRKDALSMVTRCIECGSCYVDCAFGNYGDDPALCSRWVRESNDFIRGKIKHIDPDLYEANLQCTQCNRCHTSCPEGIYRRHGNMLMKHMTGNPLRHRINIHPYSNWHIKQTAIEKFVVPKWKKEEQDWYETLNQFKPADVLLYHGCYVYSQAPQCMKLEKMLAAAGVTFTAVGKLEYCCGNFAFFRGHSDMETIRPRLLEMVERISPDRIITLCGHCYNSMSDLVSQLDEGKRPRVIHAVEELLDLNINRSIEFAHLGRSYSIHDSCNFRQLHDDHSPLRSFLRRIGSIHELSSHGSNSKCCGDVSRYFAPDHIERDNRKSKVREFISSGSDNMVLVCAGCSESLGSKDILKTVELMDVAYEAFATARSEELERASKKIPTENMTPLFEEE